MKYNEQYHKRVHNPFIEDEEYYLYRSSLSYKRFFLQIKDLNKKKVLEYGCGMGQNLFIIKDFNVFGYDISEFSKNFLKKKGIKIISNKSEIDKFDIILCSQVLEHLQNPLKELKFINSKLNKDGKFLLSLPCEKHRKTSLEPDFIDNHLYAWNFKTINNLLDLAGFKVIKNKFFYASGYKKFKKLGRIDLKLYFLFLRIFGYILNSKELEIIAIKK